MTKLSPKLAVARRLAETYRLRLFPVTIKDGVKKPALKGWQAAATDDPAKLERWFGKQDRQIGVYAEASGLIVIDTDCKHGIDGDANMRTLAGEHVGDLDATFATESPTGSRHYYFRGDPVASKSSVLAPAVDVKSRGGFVVGPGSETGKGVYRVINSAPIADIPQWLIDAIAHAYTAQADARKIEAIVELDTDAALAGALAYLAEAPVSVEGQGGNDTAYRVAARLKDLGVSEDGALDAMDIFTDWNARCCPPWERDELAEIVGHAYAYGENSPGVASPEIEFDDIADDAIASIGAPPPLSEGRLTFLTDADIKIGRGKRREYVIKGVLARGDFGIIIAHPGIGKSLIAPYIGRRVANGEICFGRRTRAGAVFYVAAEDPTGMGERTEALQMKLGLAPSYVLVTGVSNLAEKKSPDLRVLLHAAKEQRPILTFIDTMAVAFPGIDENTAADMGRVVAICRAIAKASGGAVVLIHHLTKAGGDTPRGHGVLDGALDMRMKLERDDRSGIVSGKLGKNRNGALDWFPAFKIAVAELGIDEDGDTITAAYVDESTEARKPRSKLSRSAQGALDVLNDMLDGGTAGVLLTDWQERCCEVPSSISAAEKIGSRERAFRRALADLIDRKKVSIVPTPEGELAMPPGADDFELQKDGPFPDDAS